MHDEAPRPLYLRIARITVGGSLVLLGILGLFLPVMPGWLLIVPGLALLAREFHWAHQLLEGAKRQLARVRPDHPQAARPPAEEDQDDPRAA